MHSIRTVAPLSPLVGTLTKTLFIQRWLSALQRSPVPYWVTMYTILQRKAILFTSPHQGFLNLPKNSRNLNQDIQQNLCPGYPVLPEYHMSPARDREVPSWAILDCPQSAIPTSSTPHCDDCVDLWLTPLPARGRGVTTAAPINLQIVGCGGRFVHQGEARACEQVAARPRALREQTSPPALTLHTL